MTAIQPPTPSHVQNAISPYARAAFFASVRACKRTCRRGDAIVLQSQLDKLYSSSPINLPSRLAVTMAIIYTMLMYSGGFPILYLIGAGVMWLNFALDKFLLLRVQRRPPQVGGFAIMQALKMLRYAVLLHCGITFWMYGSSTYMYDAAAGAGVLNKDAVLDRVGGVSANMTFSAAYSKWVSDLEDSYDPILVLPRAVKSCSFPYFAVVVSYIAGRLLWNVAGRQLLRLLTSIARCVRACRGLCTSVLRSCCRGAEEVVDDVGEMLPPLSSAFVIYFRGDALARYRPTRAEEAQGWKVERCGGPVGDDAGHDSIYERYKVWLSDGIDQLGVQHRGGDRKRTWEVIRDAGLHTYDIMANEQYRQAFLARLNATDLSALDDYRHSVAQQVEALREEVRRAKGRRAQAASWRRGKAKIAPLSTFKGGIKGEADGKEGPGFPGRSGSSGTPPAD